MNKKQMTGAIVAAILFICVGVTSVLTNTLSQSYTKKMNQSLENLMKTGTDYTLPKTSYIGTVQVKGEIGEQADNSSLTGTESTYQHNDILNYIDSMLSDSNNKGILLEVDSPGGAVYETNELYQKIEEYKTKTHRPVWTYMEHYAASGGYYVSAASDKIYANPQTTTGSIGVIISGYDMSGLYEKLGIKSISVTSGKNKDMSSPNAEQLQIYQSMVDESFSEFVSIVAKGRNMSEAEVKQIADGRVYTAKQAKANGLIDEISLFDDMKLAMKKEVGDVKIYTPSRTNNVLNTLFTSAADVVPKSEAQVLMDASKEYGSGVLMYYAEGLE